MHFEVLVVPNAMVGESRNPNLSRPTQLSLRTKRKPAFDALHGSFKALMWRYQHMKMIRHYNKTMQQESLGPVSKEHLNE